MDKGSGMWYVLCMLFVRERFIFILLRGSIDSMCDACTNLL